MAFSVVIITGLSGSGMSSAGRAFEDIGYYLVDNLPPQLIPTFVDLCVQSSEIPRAAIVVDSRSGGFLDRLPGIHDELEGRGIDTRVIFLEADDSTLVQRYSETRRPHPRGVDGVSTALRREREELAPLREIADEVIDTSELTIHDLRQDIRERFRPTGEGHEMAVTLTSFGFKRGTPRDLDMLFDLRFLPNPHFVPALRPLTGRDAAIVEFLEAQPDVRETLDRLVDLLVFLIPKYRREGKSYLNVGVACTGGRHRSVYFAETMRVRLASHGIAARVEHRDVDRK